MYESAEKEAKAHTHFCKNLENLAKLLPTCDSCGINENMDRDMSKLIQKPVRVGTKLGTNQKIKKITDDKIS